jgi:hypothetical protein
MRSAAPVAQADAAETLAFWNQLGAFRDIQTMSRESVSE